MNEREKFIKYLDGQMSEKEEKNFEHLLYLNPRINDIFKNFKDIYKLSKSEIETDSRYFSTLIPRAKK